MRRNTKSRNGIGMVICGILLLFSACMHPGPTPPVAFLAIRTFYKTPGGADLLNPGTPNSFKKDDIKVVSDIEMNGVTKEVTYDFGGVVVDNETGFTCLEITIPTNWGRNPIRTRVTLSPTVVDTLTYTYNSSTHQYFPGKIFYNKKQAWNIDDANRNGAWPPMTIVR